jgi:hypothetical protein
MILSLAVSATCLAQEGQLDSSLVALTYHKLSGDAFDARTAASYSAVVRNATEFDREDALNHESAALQAQLADATASHDFFVRVDDNVSQYDHARGEFSIMLFKPGMFVPMRAFGQDYQLVFANEESVRAIAMPKDEARTFDAMLTGIGRRITDEIHFRVTGAGDPSGGVTGPRVIKAEITGLRILDPNGKVLFTPNPSAAAQAQPAAPAFDIARADIAGLRVGTSADDAVATIERIYGPVTHSPAPRSVNPGFTEALAYNDGGCFTMPGSSKNPKPGAMCITAYTDKGGIVRAIRIERVFKYFDQEVFRSSLVRKYGAVAGATSGGAFSLGWGPQVDPTLLYDRSAPPYALTAEYITNDDFMSRGMNSLPQIRVVLSLVDANWARTLGK